MKETPPQTENETPITNEKCFSIRKNPKNRRKVPEPMIQSIIDAATVITNQIKASIETSS